MRQPLLRLSPGPRNTFFLVSLVGVLLLASCTLEIGSPDLQIYTAATYDSREVIIPYEVQGSLSGMEVRLRARRFRPEIPPAGEWESINSWSFVVPAGTAGTLPMDLQDGRYDVSGEVYVERGGLSATSPALTRTEEFFVDTSAPFAGINFSDQSQPGPPYSAAIALEIEPVYDGTPDPDTETDVTLYYRLDSTIRPTTEDTPVTGPIQIWPGGAASYDKVLSVVAIDAAGNVGSHFIRFYQAP